MEGLAWASCTADTLTKFSKGSMKIPVVRMKNKCETEVVTISV